MRVDILGNLGAYLSQFGPYIPWLGATMANGTYDIDTLYARLPAAVYTHTVPVDAYRAPAGRKAHTLWSDSSTNAPARLKNRARRNSRPQFRQPMPYVTQTARTYDVGDFEGAMRASLAKADYAGFGARAEAAKKSGLIRGIGISSYIECTGGGGRGRLRRTRS